MAGDSNYMSWTKNGLIQRVRELEAELKSRPAPPAPEPEPEPAQKQPEDESSGAGAPSAGVKAPKPKGKRKPDPSKYSTRYVALKLAYLGKSYGGFEFQAMATQPSIEEELWNALTKACLIFPKDDRVVDFECCEYSKCGRTDKGVSAFGQVIGLRVRSNRPLPKKRSQASQEVEGDDAMVVDEQPREKTEAAKEEEEEEDSSFDPIKDELQYPRILNRILPPDIRILAWCPAPPPDFSARFSCRERQYRYFFTQPAFSPDPKSGGKAGWLDIEAMRDAAKRYEGEHDFRNLCKIDPGKQITNFSRVIYEADIEEVKDVSSALPYLSNPCFAPAAGLEGSAIHPKVYSFNVRGSAFLWHQIRHMVAVLFLVGQRLEKPDIITQLLDTAANPCKPNYVMADEVPLVLWDCIFPGDDAAPTMDKKDALSWIYLADDPALGQFGQFGVIDGLWSHWRERKLDELLSNQLLQLVSRQGGSDPERRIERPETAKQANSVIVYEGGNCGRMGGRYIPLMKKDRLQAPEVQNERYAKRKGFAGSEDMRQQKGFGRRKVDASTADGQ
ncbi:pseudouridine synthase [Dactylonectria macrodidyma]|uniref:Pseudouridine synthase n=1 Tax=Dactylonectria macrodidyma TaxID=307937 RepID=A0A9P9EXH7_9HYPO|nr:pseudouridine synthase [Dactylonectria macrodidyma]